jgi:hypothetical protein
MIYGHAWNDYHLVRNLHRNNNNGISTLESPISLFFQRKRENDHGREQTASIYITVRHQTPPRMQILPGRTLLLQSPETHK